MTPHEKIQQLAMAALRAAPPSAGVPKPVTFMAAPEKLKAAVPAAPVEAPAPAVPAAATVAVTPVAESVAPTFKDQADPELRAMIEAREKQHSKSLSRRSLAVTCSVLALIGSACTYIAITPSARAKVAKVVPLFQETVHDVKSLGSLTQQYDESLKKVAVHGEHIDAATRSMGVDPTEFKAEDNASFDEEMTAMMGEGGRTTAQRDREVQQKLGVVKKLLRNE